jgi:hypothetical protein
VTGLTKKRTTYAAGKGYLVCGCDIWAAIQEFRSVKTVRVTSLVNGETESARDMFLHPRPRVYFGATLDEEIGCQPEDLFIYQDLPSVQQLVWGCTKADPLANPTNTVRAKIGATVVGEPREKLDLMRIREKRWSDAIQLEQTRV